MTKGRPAKTFNSSDVKLAQYMYIAGSTQETIAKALGVSVPTLRKNLKEDLAVAKEKMDGFVVGHLFSAINSGNVSAIVFYLKTRCGWSDRMPEDQVKEVVFGVLKPTVDIAKWEQLAAEQKKRKKVE